MRLGFYHGHERMTQWLDRGDGIRLAFEKREGNGSTIVFLPGYTSHMKGGKATAFDEYCAAHHRPLLKLDYSGHGESGGTLESGTIGGWYNEAALVIEHAAAGKLTLVGSSLGGWIALLLARRFGPRVAGLLLIAPAVDYTQELLWPRLKPNQQRKIMEQGSVLVERDNGEPYLITREFIEDGKKHCLRGTEPIPIDCPIRLLHGQEDKIVPWKISMQVAKAVRSEDVRIVLVKDGGHRLSRPRDLALMLSFFGEDGL